MYHKHNLIESKTIRWSVIVLCMSLILVYVILYYAKWDLRKLDLYVSNTWDVLNITQLTTWDNEIKEEYENNFDTWLLLDYFDTWVNWLITWSSITWFDIITWNLIENENKEASNWDSEMIILSGTRTYYGELDFVNTLWISYKYALVDDKDIYYLNMWSYEYDFSDIARKLRWNLYIMNTDQEIISNALFGDKITFINIPEYKNKKVLLLLDINNQSWLLAIDYSIYHQVKPYLKSLFIY